MMHDSVCFLAVAISFGSILLLSIDTPLVLSSGLTDHPIVGDEVVYLDGADWEAETVNPGQVTGCSFEENTDFNHGGSSPGQTAAESPEECCRLCAGTIWCVAGVF